MGGTTAASVGETGCSSGAPEHAVIIKKKIAMKAVPMIETRPPLRSRPLKVGKFSGFKNAECCSDTRPDYIKGSPGRGSMSRRLRGGDRSKANPRASAGCCGQAGHAFVPTNSAGDGKNRDCMT